MTDARTAQGVGKMFPGTLGGHARPAQPVTPPAPARVRWVIPPSPPIVSATAGIFDYYHWLFGPDDYTDEDMRFQGVASPNYLYEAPGVTHTEYAGNIIAWHIPPLAYVYVDVWFDFAELPLFGPPEGQPGYSDPISRDLHLVITRDSDSAVLVDETETFTGTRGMTQSHMTRGPYTLPDAFTLVVYANWGTIYDRGDTHSQNTRYPNPAINVNGHFL